MLFWWKIIALQIVFNIVFKCLELKQLADEVQNKEYSVSRVSNDVPRQQVLKSPEWQTLKIGFIRNLIFWSQLRDRSYRFWWWILEIRCIGDTLDMLVTALTTLVTSIYQAYHQILILLLAFKMCHQHHYVAISVLNPTEDLFHAFLWSVWISTNMEKSVWVLWDFRRNIK